MDVFEDIMVDAIDYDTLKEHEVYVTISEAGEENDGLLELLKRSVKYYIRNETKAHYLPLHSVSDKEIHDGIVASCSVPIVFSPVVMNGKKYYDGGVFDNTPVKPLAEHGCDEIIVIHLHKWRSQVNKEEYPDIVFHEIRHKKGREMGRILRFTDEQTKQLYDYGYEDTMAYFNNLENNED